MESTKTLIPCLAVVVLLSMIRFTESSEVLVGSKKDAWQIPSPPDALSNWAKKARFQIGDSIVFVYDGKTDSVLEVSEADYTTCNKSNPIKSYNDGNTKIELTRSGPFFFISGAQAHCEKAQKLEIRVLSPRHGGHREAAPAPSPSELHHHAPAPAPHNGGSALKAGFLTIFAVVGILCLV